MYEYRCDKCGERFEKLVRSTSSQESIACPSCGASETRKQFSTFAAVGLQNRDVSATRLRSRRWLTHRLMGTVRSLNAADFTDMMA